MAQLIFCTGESEERSISAQRSGWTPDAVGNWCAGGGEELEHWGRGECEDGVGKKTGLGGGRW